MLKPFFALADLAFFSATAPARQTSRVALKDITGNELAQGTECKMLRP